MDKTDVVKIIEENFEEAHKLLWENRKDKETILPNKVFAISGASEGNVTKVRMSDKDCLIECYFEDNEEFNSGWTDICDFSYGYENNIYLAIGEMFETKKDNSKLYRELILNTLVSNGVKRINFIGDSNGFSKKYNYIEVNEDKQSMNVSLKGLDIVLQNISFDFSIDYACLLYYIEHDLFLVQHGSKPKHDIEFIFM